MVLRNGNAFGYAYRQIDEGLRGTDFPDVDFRDVVVCFGRSVECFGGSSGDHGIGESAVGRFGRNPDFRYPLGFGCIDNWDVGRGSDCEKVVDFDAIARLDCSGFLDSGDFDVDFVSIRFPKIFKLVDPVFSKTLK